MEQNHRFTEGHLPKTSAESTSLQQKERSRSHGRETSRLPTGTDFSLALCQQKWSAGTSGKQKDLLRWDTAKLPPCQKSVTRYEELQLRARSPKRFSRVFPGVNFVLKSLAPFDHWRWSPEPFQLPQPDSLCTEQRPWELYLLRAFQTLPNPRYRTITTTASEQDFSAFCYLLRNSSYDLPKF